MKKLHVMVLGGILLLLNGSAYAESDGGRPGDDFRQAAADYEDNASKAVKEATQRKGKDVSRYLELSSIYREMAIIKHEAAAMADENRWNDISWDRYHQLESKRDQLLGQLDHGKKKKGSGSKSNNAFIDAAKNYENQARHANEKAQQAKGQARHIFMELSGVYQQMAGIKYQAASAADIGKDFDWSHYQVLEERRDQLKNELKHAKH